MSDLLTAANTYPFPIGFVRNGEQLPQPINFRFHRVVVRWPSRINAMAIDPARVAVDCNGRFSPGEILFSVRLPLEVELSVSPGEGVLVCGAERKSIVRHAVEIMRWCTGFQGRLHIQVSGIEYPHCGFGSSGRLLAAVAAGVNELLGRPIDNDSLQIFLAENHGEEVAGSLEKLSPVQCIGGAASSGLHRGAIQVLAGQSSLIASVDLPPEYRITLAWPTERVFADANDAMAAELANMRRFYDIGVEYGPMIAYRVLHELLPALRQRNLKKVGEIIEWYRYDLGSNAACSFCHPNSLTWLAKLREAKESLGVEMCGISSVGPAMYAVSRKPEASESFFKGLGLQTVTTRFHNDQYRVLVLE